MDTDKREKPQAPPPGRQKAFADHPDKRKVMRQAKSDLDAGREDTECRGEKPASKRCP